MPSMTVQSAGMKRLLRDIESRRTTPALSPAGRVAKKFCHSSPQPLAPPCTVEECSVPAAGDEPIKKGALVSVRTRVGKIGAGLNLHLVLRLGAVVVSDADEDGFLDVVYDVRFPLDDPFRPVRMSRDQVKVMMPTAAVTNFGAPLQPPPPHSTNTKSKDKVSGPRPTVAGKSLRLLTKLERERTGNYSLVLRP
uniref:Uncharacterized protein n=1 Tax=Oryza punctata TaxID=4537 RepID=A0A0E0KZQ9_ORYPU